nr:MAG: replication initiator protein [Microvirus sp.]
MECISPISLPRPNGLGSIDRITVPCGRCFNCMSLKRNQWAYRIQQQLKVSYTAYFVTLTYSDDHLLGNLCKKDIQDFLKRVRKGLTNSKKNDLVNNGIRVSEKTKVSEIASKGLNMTYYIIGEYGSKTFRPHYHGIFFNLPNDPQLMLINHWKKGFVHVGQVNPASIKYATKYMITKSDFPDGLVKPFMLVSKGMGLSYVEKMKEWHISGERFYAPDLGGKKVALPRYYRDKMFNKSEIHLNKLRTTIKSDRLKEVEDRILKAKGENPDLYRFLRNKQNNELNLKSINKTNKL